MSNEAANKNLATFGLLSLILAIFSIIAFVTGIVSWIFSFVTYINWGVLGIIMVLLIIGGVFVGKAGDNLNDDNARIFRTKIIVAVILVFVAMILIGVSIATIIVTATGQTPLDPGSPEAIGIYVTYGIMILAGIAMIIVGAVFEIIAWGKLKRFFDSKLAMFPEDIGKSAKTGAFLCQLGAIFNITFILAPVGAILKVVGYFMLFKLKKL